MTWILENMTMALPPVFAQMRKASDIYSKWGTPPDSNGAMITLIVVTLLLSVAAFFIARHMLTLMKHASPGTTLFDELAKAHSLSKNERTALKRITRHEKLSTASELFVRKAYLETYAKSKNPLYKKLFKKLF